MNRVLQFLDNFVKGLLNWIYSLPPDTFKEYEVALVAYLVSVHVLNPSDQAAWIAAGFVVYGIIKAVRDVSNASVAKATIQATAPQTVVAHVVTPVAPVPAEQVIVTGTTNITPQE